MQKLECAEQSMALPGAETRINFEFRRPAVGARRARYVLWQVVNQQIGSQPRIAHRNTDDGQCWTDYPQTHSPRATPTGGEDGRRRLMTVTTEATSRSTRGAR